MYTIPTLHDLRRHLGLSAADADADQDLMRALANASRLIESLTQRRFCPRLERRAVPINPITPRLLILPDDLLELHSVRDAAGELDLDLFLRVPENPDEPASVLHLSARSAFLTRDSAPPAVTVSGLWGWHDRWTRAWVDSGDAIREASLLASATSIAVSDANGSDAAGFSPRFQVGQLLRIKDEYLRLTAVDIPNQRLTAQRGVSGTAAADHQPGATIETYVPPLPIHDLTLRYAQLMLKSQSLLPDEPSALLSRMRRLTV